MKPEDQQLLERLPLELHDINGVPSKGGVRDRKRAATLVERSLREFLYRGGIRYSPLGPEWSRDIDAYVTDMPPRERLESLGWLPLDGLLNALGSAGDGRWLVTDGTKPLALVDFHAAKPPPGRVAAVLDRCRKQRQVRLREVLELRVLIRDGQAPPPHDPIVAVAARIESGLGGALLAGWLNGRALEAPAELRAAPLRSVARKIRTWLRPKVVIAVSGVDGSGKSTLCTSLAQSMAKAAIPATMVWTRPGMRLRLLDRIAALGKRVLRQDSAPGIRSVAEGGEPGALASRRGFLGWMWALLVTLAFLFDVRKRHLRARGVVLYDRHLLDALVTLHFAYGGVGLRFQAALIKMFLPHAAVTLYLKAPADVAVERKPGDVIGEHAVTRQLELYERFARDIGNLHELDATAAPSELTMSALYALAGRWSDLPSTRAERLGGR